MYLSINWFQDKGFLAHIIQNYLVANPIILPPGADFYWSFKTGKARQSSLGPTTIESILGWVLSGPYERNVRPTSTNFVNSHVLNLATEPSPDTKLDLKLKQFCKYESFNTNTNPKSSDFNFKKFESQITFNNDKYEVILGEIIIVIVTLIVVFRLHMLFLFTSGSLCNS